MKGRISLKTFAPWLPAVISSRGAVLAGLCRDVEDDWPHRDAGDGGVAEVAGGLREVARRPR